eukprot:1029274-Rhodomonas_salina.2
MEAQPAEMEADLSGVGRRSRKLWIVLEWHMLVQYWPCPRHRIGRSSRERAQGEGAGRVAEIASGDRVPGHYSSC